MKNHTHSTINGNKDCNTCMNTKNNQTKEECRFMRAGEDNKEPISSVTTFASTKPQKDEKKWTPNRKYEPISYGVLGYSEEYLCEHGIGHEMGIHGCDGCCSDPSFKKLYKNKQQKERVNFFEMSEEDQLKIITHAGEESNRKQKELVDRVEKICKCVCHCRVPSQCYCGAHARSCEHCNAFIERIVNHKVIVHTPPKGEGDSKEEPIQEWEDIIERILVRNFDNNKYRWSSAHEELKSFISSLLTSQREEFEKVVLSCYYSEDDEDYEKYKYNEALDLILCKLSNSKDIGK